MNQRRQKSRNKPFPLSERLLPDLATTFESLSIGLNEKGFEPLDRGKESFRRFTAQTCGGPAWQGTTSSMN